MHSEAEIERDADSESGERWTPLTAGAWMLGAAVLAVVLGVASGSLPAQRVFHPEALYPAALQLDLAADPGAWRSWSTPPAPYLFPDLPLYFCADVLAGFYGGGALWAVLLCGAFQLVLLAWALSDAGWWVGGGRAASTTAAATALAFAAWAWGLHGGGLLLQALAPAFHAGAVVVGIWGLVLLLGIVSKHGTRTGFRWRLATLALLVYLATLSDRLFVPFFVVPALLVLVLESARSRHDRLRLVVSWIAVAGSAVAGWLSVPLLESFGPEVPSLHPVDAGVVVERFGSLLLSPGEWLFVVDRFFEGLGWGYRLLFFACLVGLAAACFAGVRRIRLAARFLLASTVLTVAATFWITVGDFAVRAGNESLLFVNRYLLGVYLLPILGVGLAPWLLPVPSRGRRIVLRGLPVLALLVALGAIVHHRDVFRDDPETDDGAWHPAPEVACMERELGDDVQTGLAHFYAARRIQVFSRGRLHADQLGDDLEPTTWIDSRERQGSYRFVLLDRLDPAAVEARFGAPDRRFDCAGSRVWEWDEAFAVP